ncbi:MAG: biotin/lipoyl-containing protein, partial [Phycisphaerales bacterium]
MPVDLTIPSPGESITEVVIGSWAKSDGDWVEKDDLLAEIESDKATLELRAPAAGRLAIGAAPGTEVSVGTSVGSIDPEAAKPAGGGASPAAAAPAVAASAPTPASAGPVSEGGKATSVAKKIAAEKGIAVGSLSGPGPGGRVPPA